MQRQRRATPPQQHSLVTFLPYRKEAVPYIPSVLSLSLMHGRCQQWPNDGRGHLWNYCFGRSVTGLSFKKSAPKRVSESQQHWPGA
jgi:hypothetical protein